jgi:hypothetical protein
MMNAYICYFDSLGFEWIVNVTEYEKKKVMAYLKGEPKIKFPVPRYAVLRARANPQRFPEIWAFESDITLEELEKISQESPQVLVDAIRNCGQNIFKTERTESVII